MTEIYAPRRYTLWQMVLYMLRLPEPFAAPVRAPARKPWHEGVGGPATRAPNTELHVDRRVDLDVAADDLQAGGADICKQGIQRICPPVPVLELARRDRAVVCDQTHVHRDLP